MSYIGKTFGGKYKIVRKVGSGGMGSVYAAEKITTHELFALKFMNREFIADETYIQRFKREIASLNAIRHPNVVNVFDWYLPSPDSEDLPYIVMELLDGEGLDELLDRKKKLTVEETIAIMLQVLDGLAAAHEIGVIHRDLGTTNVFLFDHPDKKLHVKLLDFGLAKPLHAGEQHANITKEGTVIGKAAFAAPEIFHDLKLDGRSDIFACGMMMMRMLTGRLPYKEAKTHLLWVERYTDRENKADYPSCRTFNPDLPESLDRLVSLAIKKMPEQRYGDARRMQADLLNVEHQLRGKETTEEISSSDLALSEAKEKAPPEQPAGPARPAPSGTPSAAGAATSAISKFDVLEPEKPKKKKVIFIAAAAVAVVVIIWAVAAILLSGFFKKTDPAHVSTEKEKSSQRVEQPTTVRNDKDEADSIHVVVLGAPKGAAVKIGDRLLEGSPPEGHLPRGDKELSVEVSAEGYEPYSETIIPKKDIVLSVTMVKSVLRENEREKVKEKPEKKKGKMIKGRMGTKIKTDYGE